MDTIHDVDKKPWISRRILNLDAVIEERQFQLKSNNVYLQEPMVEQDELFKELEKFAKSNNESVMQQFLFNTSDEKALVIDPDCNLSTYKIQLQHSKKVLSDRAYKVEYLNKLQLTRRELLMRHLATIDQFSSEQDLPTKSNKDYIQGMVTLLTIQTWLQPSTETKVRLEKEIIVRADDFLTDLRSQIKCQLDYAVPMELSDNPEPNERISRGELFKSSFLLIHDSFYNDMRDKNNIDLSAVIRDWATKPVMIVNGEGQNELVSRGIGPFRSKRMEETRFRDLQFRLGCPYLFMHQGNCEHLFTITDIRYVPNNELIRDTQFPLITATSIGGKKDQLKCYMCKDRPPHWFTRKNDRLPLDPFFFCEDCFYSFNYDCNKKKVGHFQAYLYTSSLGIPDSIVMKMSQ